MHSVVLPNGRATSHIGFGCGSLRGGSESETSRALIAVALDAGIRHFDLAPPYGLGMAEDIAGGVLGPLRHEVTITTKAGIARPNIPGFLTVLRQLAKPVVSRIPGVWEAVASNVRNAASARGCFDPDFVSSSIAESLRRLQGEAADIVLMHEMQEADVTPELLSVLVNLVEQGRIGALGTGGDRDEGDKITARYPVLGQVRQFRWNVLDPPISTGAATLLITHGAIGSVLDSMISQLEMDPEKTRDWSANLDADLADPLELCDLLLAAALAENAQGIVLFASRNPTHIRRAAAVAANQDLIEKGRRLGGLVRADARAGCGAGSADGDMMTGGRVGA